MLTDRQIERAKANGKLQRLLDGDGLFLRISTTGGKSWVLRATWAKPGQGKKVNDMGLGPYPAISLADARAMTKRAHTVIATGGCPIQDREAQQLLKAAALQIIAEQAPGAPKGPTFASLAPEAVKVTNLLKAKPRAAWVRGMQQKVGELAQMQPKDVTTDHVVTALTPYWYDYEDPETGKVTPAREETARRMRANIETVLDYAHHAGLIPNPDWANPATINRLRFRLRQAKAKTADHRAALDWREVPAFMTELRDLPGTVCRSMVEFTILTCVRSFEARFATWSEIDFAAKLWRIPKERMKGRSDRKRAHDIPLSDAALAVLKRLRDMGLDTKPGALIFPPTETSRRQKHPVISENGMTSVLRDMGYSGRATMHGFRASFKSWAGAQKPTEESPEIIPIDREIAELCLAHATGNAAEEAYKRDDYLDLRREALNRWAAFCGRGTNVKPFRARAA